MGRFWPSWRGGLWNIRWSEFLPSLSDGIAVLDNGLSAIKNQDFLTGSGSIGFKVTLKQDQMQADFANSLGVYEVDSAGNIVDVKLLAADVVAAGTADIDITGVEAGNKLGFFLVQNGADWAKSLADTDVLSFIDSADGAAANVSDAANVALAVGGVAAGLAVLHSFDRSLNSDGKKHALTGVDLGGKSISVGFEDLLAGSDNDCQDVVFCVETFDL